eukprot:167367_1
MQSTVTVENRKHNDFKHEMYYKQEYAILKSKLNSVLKEKNDAIDDVKRLRSELKQKELEIEKYNEPYLLRRIDIVQTQIQNQTNKNTKLEQTLKSLNSNTDRKDDHDTDASHITSLKPLKELTSIEEMIQRNQVLQQRYLDKLQEISCINTDNMKRQIEMDELRQNYNKMQKQWNEDKALVTQLQQHLEKGQQPNLT